MGHVSLSPLVRGILESYPNLQADKAEVTIEGELPVVKGSESLLTQCFSNLLGNAAKFVAPGAKARIRLRAEPLEGLLVRIWVEDDGIGIAPLARKRLFGMFQKVHPNYEGSGIVLAIVRKVVERMGGRVGVESEPGKGSRFWVELARAAD